LISFKIMKCKGQKKIKITQTCNTKVYWVEGASFLSFQMHNCGGRKGKHRVDLPVNFYTIPHAFSCLGFPRTVGFPRTWDLNHQNKDSPNQTEMVDHHTFNLHLPKSSCILSGSYSYFFSFLIQYSSSSFPKSVEIP
jgi:hypothetical protein